MDIAITPRPLTGTIRAISSKSDAHRCLIAAALCQAPTVVHIPDLSQDIRATIDCLRALGATVTIQAKGDILVQPGPAAPAPHLDCGESGSTLRFLLPVAAALAKAPTFSGRGRLPDRPVTELRQAMEAHGCRFSAPKLPFTLSGELSSGEYVLPGNVSSQYITGLLMALPLLEGSSYIRLTSPLESAGYVAMTRRTLERFSIETQAVSDGFFVPGGQAYRSPGRIAAEGDWSNAAFWLTAGAVGAPVTVTGLALDTVQGDAAVCRLLAAFGASVQPGAAGVSVVPAPLSPLEIDAGPIPDLVPILAVAAARASGDTRIYNAGRLRIKESDRLSAVTDLLTRLGGRVTEGPDSLIIQGSGSLSGGTVYSHNDHRIAMAAAIASTFCVHPVTITDAQAVDKSYPQFFNDFQTLGGNCRVL